MIRRLARIALLGVPLLAGCQGTESDTPFESPDSMTVDLDLALEPQLREAITSGDVDAVTLILTEYPDVDERFSTGIAPLHFAIRADQPEVVAVLAAAGASLEARDSQSQTPLMVAATHSTPEVFQALLDAGADLDEVFAPNLPSSAWHFAASAGNIPVLELILELGVDIDSVGGFGRTAVNWAAFSRQPEMVEYLLELGVDPNIPDTTGRTARAWAEFYGDEATAEALTTAGGEI